MGRPRKQTHPAEGIPCRRAPAGCAGTRVEASGRGRPKMVKARVRHQALSPLAWPSAVKRLIAAPTDAGFLLTSYSPRSNVGYRALVLPFEGGDGLSRSIQPAAIILATPLMCWVSG